MKGFSRLLLVYANKRTWLGNFTAVAQPWTTLCSASILFRYKYDLRRASCDIILDKLGKSRSGWRSRSGTLLPFLPIHPRELLLHPLRSLAI